MKNHTATHLLQAALIALLGKQVSNQVHWLHQIIYVLILPIMKILHPSKLRR